MGRVLLPDLLLGFRTPRSMEWKTLTGSGWLSQVWDGSCRVMELVCTLVLVGV